MNADYLTFPTFEPEADLVDLANHNFSALSLPLLVACYDREQFEEFVFREGLMCSEVRRFRGKVARESYPENKVLILLPAWDADLATKDAVDRWIFLQDRYTVTLRTPRPLIDRPRYSLLAIATACGALWGALAWWLLR